MSDDLVEQLDKLARRAETSNIHVQEFRMMRSEGVADIIYEAKFRIEELEERLKAATDDAKEAEAYAAEMEEKLAEIYFRADRIEELEAKLAKAVEALEGMMMHMPDFADTVWIDARTTLAELKGETDAA
jgi:chromosome segregation ATPase